MNFNYVLLNLIIVGVIITSNVLYWKLTDNLKNMSYYHVIYVISMFNYANIWFNI